MSDHDLITRIRTIFLHQRPIVTISEAARLLGWTADEMARAIADGEIEAYDTFTGGWMWREELIAKAMEIWPQELIEDALGDDAGAVLPDAIRLTDLRVRLPRYHVDMLEHFAERDRTTVSATLTRELDAVASAHAEELAGAVRGFIDALRAGERRFAVALLEKRGRKRIATPSPARMRSNCRSSSPHSLRHYCGRCMNGGAARQHAGKAQVGIGASPSPLRHDRTG